jgi:hypothetical protein
MIGKGLTGGKGRQPVGGEIGQGRMLHKSPFMMLPASTKRSV